MFGTGSLTSPAAAAVQVETPIRPKAHQKQGNFPDIRGAVQRFRAATVEWTTEWSDEWVRRYGNKNKVVASTENDPLIDRLRKETGEDFDDISPFFDWYPSSRLLDRQARRVKGFCEGSTPLIDNSSKNDPENEPSNTDQETSAWVSDRNWPKDATNKKYGRILDGQQLDEVLQKKRFSENGRDEEAGPPRRIYINKPNRNNINAILRTTPPSQVPGFQELMTNYITGDPSPVLRSREIFWWGAMCFLFSFNLPFFATTFQARQDNRTLFNGKRLLRRRHDLSFLKMGVSDQDYYEGDDGPREPLYLLGGVCSIVVTGRSERYWTAACLNDDLSPDEDEPRLSMESEKHRMGPETDPIILKTENEAVSPRAYALAALATALTKIVDYHRDIQIEFGISLSHHTCKSWHGRPENIPFEQMQEWRIRYLEVLNWVIDGNARIVEKLERFLSRDLLVSPEGLPQHPLWQSVFKEERVTQSLTEIRYSLDHLSDVDSELRRLLKTCIEERREMKNKYQDEQSKFQDEQSRRDKRIQKITFAGFVLAILNLVAQIYAGRPENISVLSSPGFMALTWVSLVICFIICLAPFWDNVLWFLKNLPQYLRGFAMAIKNFTTQQLGCLKAFLTFGKCFMLGVARGVLKLRRVDVVLRKTRARVFWRRERGILPT